MIFWGLPALAVCFLEGKGPFCPFQKLKIQFSFQCSFGGKKKKKKGVCVCVLTKIYRGYLQEGGDQLTGCS